MHKLKKQEAQMDQQEAEDSEPHMGDLVTGTMTRKICPQFQVPQVWPILQHKR